MDEPRLISAGHLEPAPEQTAFDYGLLMAKVATLVFPFAGAGVTLFDLVTAPSRGKRLSDWCEELRIRLNDLSEKVAGLTPERLAKDDAFVSTFAHATQAALRTHQSEKRQALHNAVLNVALGKEPETDRQILFIALIDRFTVFHLNLLRAFADPKSYCLQRLIPVPMLEYGTKLLATQLVHALMPGIGDLTRSPVEDRKGTSFQMSDWVLSDLEAANLIALDRHQQTWSVPRYSSSPRPVEVGSLVTHLGEDFLAFITDPPEQQS
jgi:hypothetical protein